MSKKNQRFQSLKIKTSFLLIRNVVILIFIMCVVPENIHTSPKDGFLVRTLTPPGISSFASYFPLKILAFELPLPLGISIYHPWGGYMVIFWNHTF